jgi:ABC-2 type transport system ATP-binding protein
MNRISDDDICFTGVTKIFRIGIFKQKTAIEDVTFGVSPGEVVGLLGPNGSGKSTVIKLTLGFLKPTKGEILVGGQSNASRLSRSIIGYLPENPRFQKFLTGAQVLNYYGGLLGLKGTALKTRCEHLLELVSLQKASRERIQGYSKGMTQRLAIAQSLLNRPRLVIFDEPMSGLDPLGRIEIRNLMLQIRSELPNTTLFFSTHILSDVEQLCTSVILLKKGHLTKQCRIEELIGGDRQRFEITIKAPDNLSSSDFFRSHPGVTTPMGLTLNTEGPDGLFSHLEQLKKLGVSVVGINSRRISLEEALFADSKITEVRNREITAQ